MSNITVITLNQFGKRARGCCVHVFLVILKFTPTLIGARMRQHWFGRRDVTTLLSKIVGNRGIYLRIRRNWLWVLVDEVEESSQWCCFRCCLCDVTVMTCYFSEISSGLSNVNCLQVEDIVLSKIFITKGSVPKIIVWLILIFI